jgi:hypothetical protein
MIGRMRMKKERDEKTGKLVKGHAIRQEHGGFYFLRSNRIPSVRGRRRIAHELASLREKLMEAVPNSSDIRKQILIGQIIKAEGFCLLLECYLKRFGILSIQAFKEGRLEPQGALAMVAQMMNSQARAVKTLGLSEKAQEALDLGRYIEARDKEKSKKEEKSS